MSNARSTPRIDTHGGQSDHGIEEILSGHRFRDEHPEPGSQPALAASGCAWPLTAAALTERLYCESPFLIWAMIPAVQPRQADVDQEDVRMLGFELRQGCLR